MTLPMICPLPKDNCVSVLIIAADPRQSTIPEISVAITSENDAVLASFVCLTYLPCCKLQLEIKQADASNRINLIFIIRVRCTHYTRRV